jgi:PAS domain S-box-containing protein
MYLLPDTELQKRLQRWSRFLVICISAIAALALAGWNWNIPALKHFGHGFASMNPATAVSLLLIAISFYLLSVPSGRSGRRDTGNVLATIVIIIGLLKVLGVLFGLEPQLDTVLFPSKVLREVVDGFPNRMSPNTAICIMAAGVALLTLHYETRRKIVPAQFIGLGIILISIFSLLGYLYQVKHFIGLLTHIQMALNTAICFFCFGFAILFVNSDKGWMRELTNLSGASLTGRILLPAAILIPALLGLFRLWGFQVGLYNEGFGTAIYALFVIIAFAGIIMYHTIALNKKDLLEQQTENALRASEEQTRGIFDNAPDAIILIDDQGRISKWNLESERLFGWKASEVVGKLLHDTIIPPEFREAHKRGMNRYLQSGESVIMGRSIDLWGVKKNGEQIDISLRISPLPHDEKRFFIGFMRDITERKLMENKLKTFNEELSTQVEQKTSELTDIFERVTDGFIALDTNFCYTFLNKKAGQLIHHNPASLIGKCVWDIFPDAVGSETYRTFQKAMNEQIYICSTDYYEPLDLWQENHIYPSPKGLSVFIRDITESKRAEARVTEASNLADKLIDALPGVFYFYDATGKFIRWNKTFEEVTEYTPEEIATMHPTQFFPPEEQEYIAGRIGTVFTTGINDAEAHFLTKSGKRIPHYFKAVLTTYKGGPCLLGSGIDITERVKAEEQLRASETKYKLLFENNPLAMWMLGLPEYDVREVNEAALVQYGYTREEFLALDIFTIRPNEDIEHLKSITNREFRGMRHVGIWQHQKKDGTIIYTDVITDDIYYEGKPVRLVLANEVTEQHLAEERLKESYESIRKLTEHLQNIREEERLHIAREIHDELGQLLTVLKMDVSWLNKKIQPATDPVQQKLTELLSLIDTTVKTVRRIASELRPSLLDDLGLLAAMEWHLEEFERRSGIAQSAVLPDTELKLPDPIKIGLFRIFQESLTNVARHSGAKNVNVSLIQKHKQLILSITDDGKGLAEGKGESKTLGLLGMKERTSGMGGEYNISSKPGEGTTVNVMVPLPEIDIAQNQN